MTKKDEFIFGVNSVFLGIEAFFKRKSLWKYAVIPFLLTLFLYMIFIFFAVPELKEYFTEPVDSWTADWPEYLHWLAKTIQVLTAAAVYIFAVALLLLVAGPVYEITGGMFFDCMIASFYREEYGAATEMTSLRLNLLFALQSALYAAGTLFIFLFGVILFVCIPIIGPIAAMLFTGYRLGINYLALAGLQHGKSLYGSKKTAGKNFAATLGYGVTVYIIFTIPFACVFLLPGIITGGAILFNSFDPLPPPRQEDQLPNGHGDSKVSSSLLKG